MQAILDFFTGPLNTVAWMYILFTLFALSGVVAKLTREHFGAKTTLEK